MNHYRSIALSYLAVLISQISFGQWSTDPAQNNAVIQYSGDQEFHQIIPDGSGGVYVVWADSRNDAANGLDIYAQHMGADASKLWAADGLAISTAPGNQNYPYLVQDGNGGTIIFWVDYRNGDADIYAQRINSDGSSQWTANGVQIAGGAGKQSFFYPYYKMEGFVMVDGAGGAFIAYNNDADGDMDLYAQKINSSGAVQWGGSGVKITNLVNDDQAQRITSDGAGGIIVVWENYNSSDGSNAIYAQRLNASGTPQWSPADGINMVPAPAWPGKPADPEIVPDGSNGAIIVFNTRAGLSTGDLYMQRVDGGGNILWGNSGKVLSNQNQLESGWIIEPDGIGNFYISWADQRELAWPGPTYGSNYDIYAQKIDINGNKLWNADGLLVCNADSVQYTPDMLVDGDGNLVLIWRDDRNVSSNRDIYAQKVNASGLVQWSANGVPVSLGSDSQYEPYIVPGTGGFIAVWRDRRNGDDDLYTAYINPDGTLGTGIELTSGTLSFLQAQVSKDDNDCINDPAIKNGAAQASVFNSATLWREQFIGLAAGSTADGGSTAWSISGSIAGPGYAEVVYANGNYEFQGTDVRADITWQSEVFDISGQDIVGFSILLRSENQSGDAFDADDYINVYYALDGGAPVAATGGSFVGAVDANGASAGTGADQAVVNVNGLSGSMLQVIVTFNNDESTEIYAIDDVHIQGKGTAGPGFTVYWFNGAVDATPDHTGSTYSNLDAGSYNVFANNGSGSVTNTATVVIDRTEVLPTIDVQALSHETWCSAPNGVLEASAIVFGGEPASEFSFAWTSDGDATVLGTGTVLDNLAAGTYAVTATHNLSGCAHTALKEVEDNRAKPVVTATVDAQQSSCDAGAPNGTVSARVGVVTAGYTFHWFNGEVASPDILAADHTGIGYTNIIAGKYTVVAVRNDTGCESLPATVEVQEMVHIDLLTAEPTKANTACNAALATGEASAAVDGNTEPGYTFAWYEGTDTSSGVVVAGTSAATGLGSGFYTVLATETATGCTATATVEIEDQSALPVVQVTVDLDDTGCDAATANGAASANVGGSTAGYAFYWFDGNVASPDTTAADHTGTTYASLTAGEYTVVAALKATGCASAPATITIDNLVQVQLLTASADAPNTACDAAVFNGAASASVDGTTGPDYTFEWYEGTDTDTQPVVATGATVNTLGNGVYTVVATEIATGCTATAQVTIQDNTAIPVVSTGVTSEQISCDASNPLGAASADVGGTTAGYTFYWVDGTVSDPDPSLASFVGAEYTQLEAGSYTVVAQDISTGCLSEAAVVSVYDQQSDPVITLVEPGTDPLDPPDQWEANVNGLMEPYYSFEWFKGNSSSINVNSTPIGTASTVSGLDAGEYALRVTDLGTGCSSVLDFQSTVEPPLPPLIISAVATSPYSIDLGWLDRSNDEDGFIIERKTDFDTEFTEIADLSSNTTVYTDNGLTPEMYYTYRVTAYKNVGNQRAYSESVRLKTLKIPPAGQPLIVNTDIMDPAAVSLDWTYSQPNAEGFVVERLNEESLEFVTIATTTEKTYTDSEVVDGKEYTYRIFAYNDGGRSGYSNEVDVKLLIQDIVMVYPNPVKDELHIVYGGTYSYDIRLYNEDGKLIRESLKLNESQILDISTISSEMLVLQVWSNGNVISKKIVKEK